MFGSDRNSASTCKGTTKTVPDPLLGTKTVSYDSNYSLKPKTPTYLADIVYFIEGSINDVTVVVYNQKNSEECNKRLHKDNDPSFQFKTYSEIGCSKALSELAVSNLRFTNR